MPKYFLALDADALTGTAEDETPFLWDRTSASSFTTNLGPNLAELGNVPAASADFVHVALAVWAADRSTSRTGGGSSWNRREIEVRIPVSVPDAWATVADELSTSVGFLTGDSWSFDFYPALLLPEAAPSDLSTTEFERIVLLSGGADSACGALTSRLQSPDMRQLLLSHYSVGYLASVQKAVAEEIDKVVFAFAPSHVQVHLSRRATGPAETKYGTEPSSRSRSLLFLALGLAAGASHKAPLWMPENGFASLNPPLGPERRGSLSTRTTHPWFQWRLAAILSQVGAWNELANPYRRLTKGEVFAGLAQTVKETGAEEPLAVTQRYLALTNSCAHTDQRFIGYKNTVACGVCFGCTIRRAAFKAGGLEDLAPYVDPAASARAEAYVAGKTIIPAVEDFVARGISLPEIAMIPLPPDYPRSEAADLCRRGTEELRGYLP
jgi:7-cyano-7-deazaguanine synthase in queuosine biosynthesis